MLRNANIFDIIPRMTNVLKHARAVKGAQELDANISLNRHLAMNISVMCACAPSSIMMRVLVTARAQ